MRLYWANAKTADLEILSTYSGHLKYGDAVFQIKAWQDYGYKVTEAWIDVYEGGIKVGEVTVMGDRGSEV